MEDINLDTDEISVNHTLIYYSHREKGHLYGINMKVIQDVLGHADITTTMNIYTEATKNLKKKEIDKFAEFLSASSMFDGKEEND